MKLIQKDVKLITIKNESILNFLYSSHMPGTLPLHGGWTWLLATCQSLPETSTAQLVHHHHNCHHQYHDKCSQHYRHHHPFSFIHIFTYSHNNPHCIVIPLLIAVKQVRRWILPMRTDVPSGDPPQSLTLANLQCWVPLKFQLCNSGVWTFVSDTCKLTMLGGPIKISTLQ